MGKTVIGEMVMIWLAWKVINTIIKFLAVRLPIPQALQDVLVGG